MDFVHAVPAAFDYIRSHPAEFTGVVEAHLKLSFVAILIGIAIAFPLGVLASRNRYVSLYSLNTFGVLRAIPSIALLFLAYPYLNAGFTPSVVALTLLAIPPVLINTTVGFRQVDPAMREAAYAMGMTTPQVLAQIEFPLALPIVIAGLRTATVEVIASATLATFIGGGGLGDYITEGLAVSAPNLILVGAIPVAILTLCGEIILGSAERVSKVVLRYSG